MKSLLIIVPLVITPAQAEQVNSHNQSYQQNVTASNRSSIGQVGSNYINNYGNGGAPIYVQPQMPGYANFHDRAFCEPTCLADRQHWIGY